jgi:hypothetical protein
VQACGPFTCAVSKSAITLTGWPRPTRSEPTPTSATPHKTALIPRGSRRSDQPKPTRRDSEPEYST